MNNGNTHNNNAPSIADSLFRGMVESTAAIPWEVDMSTFQFVYVGPQAEKILGYPIEAWYQENFWPEHIHPDDREEALNFCIEAPKKGDDYHFKYRMIHRDGHDVWILDYVNVVFGDVNGKRVPVRLQGFMLDISEEWEAKQALRRKNILLDAMYQASPDMIFIHANDGRILDANENATSRYGYSLSDICTKSILQLSADGSSLDQAVLHVKAALRGEAPDFEWMAKDKRGKNFPIEVRLRKLDAEDDSPDAPAVIAVVRDISERKRMENAIRNIAAGVSDRTGQNFYGQLVKYLGKLFGADLAFIGLIDKDLPSIVNTIAVWSHGEFSDNFSYSLEHTPCSEVLFSEGACCYPSGIREIFPLDHVLTDIGADSYIGVPLFNSDKKPIGVIVVIDGKPMLNTREISDILEIFTTRVVAELERATMIERIESTQRRLTLHVQHTPLAIIEWRTDFTIKDWNPAAEKIFGFSKHEALGRDGRELLLLPEHYADIDIIWNNLISNSGGSHNTNLNLTKSGKLISCEWYNTPLVTNEGDVIGVASLITDVTARVRAEEELKKHHDLLEETVEQRTIELTNLNEELKSFSYSVSHDLRAPLRHIDGFSKILLEDFSEQLGEEGQGYLRRICDRAAHMGKLIESLLKLSQVTNSPLENVSIDLSKMAEDIAEKFTDLNNERTVNIQIDKDLHATGDRLLIHSVLENLLGNAWKYTNQTQDAQIQFGRVTTSAKENNKPECAARDNEVVYFVKDNGAGFDMQYINKLFVPFQRMHSESQFEGSGIGLATVKRIISRHGGRVWAEAEIDKGATFFFSLGH